MPQHGKIFKPPGKEKHSPENPSPVTNGPGHWIDQTDMQPLRLLDQENWKCWIDNGYVIIKEAVPLPQAEKLADYLWKFEGKDPKDKDTWYSRPNTPIQMKELTNTGMVEIYQHQYLWDNRQYP